MTIATSLRRVLLAVAALTAAGCSSTGPTPNAGKLHTVERGYYKVGQPYFVDGVLYTPSEDWNYDETGIASWYGPDFHGKRTANGELYNMNEVTGAHKTLPMPSLVRVTNLDNGRSIIVRVNDRGPFARGRIIDLSRRSAQLLGFSKVGTAKVRVQILAHESQELASAARNGKLWADSLAGLDPTAPPPGSSGAAMAQAEPMAEPPQPQPEAKAPPAIASIDEILAQNPESAPPVKGSVVKGRFMPAPVATVEKVHPTSIYIQAGTFSVAENAERLRGKLNQVAKTDISPTSVNGRSFYRVRVGPIATVDEADALLARIVAVGASDARIVVD